MADGYFNLIKEYLFGKAEKTFRLGTTMDYKSIRSLVSGLKVLKREVMVKKASIVNGIPPSERSPTNYSPGRLSEVLSFLAPEFNSDLSTISYQGKKIITCDGQTQRHQYDIELHGRPLETGEKLEQNKPYKVLTIEFLVAKGEPGHMDIEKLEKMASGVTA